MRSATGAKVVARFEDLTAEKLGFTGSVREISIGTDNNRLVLFEDCLNSSVVTILIRGGNSLVCVS